MSVDFSKVQNAIDNHVDPVVFFKILSEERRRIAKELVGTYKSSNRAMLLALKMANILAAKYHYLCRHTRLGSMPIQLVIEPSNNCMLSCPRCVHSRNSDYLSRRGIVWPGGILSRQAFEKIKCFFPYGSFAVFYNFGEPFLNKNFCEFVRSAKSYMLSTMTSSNLNVKAIDADLVVSSGLDMLVASIDGVTQSTYSKFRKNGALNVAFDNLKKIINAKKRHNSQHPYVRWQFLTFEHNIHEVDRAIEMAHDLGVDCINIAEPHDVCADDISIRVVRSEKDGVVHVATKSGHMRSLLAGELYNEISSSSLESLVASDMQVVQGYRSVPIENTLCDWLYKSMSIDANGKALPCCVPPRCSSNEPLDLGSVLEFGSSSWNSDEYEACRFFL